MERMLVVVCDTETMAVEGRSALRQLELEGSITIHAGAVVAKRLDGGISIKQLDDDGPIGTLAGTAVGSLIGLLGGPVGVAIGALSGMTFGAFYDIDTLRVGEDFVYEVSASLTPGKVAIIAEVDEEWTTPVDARMEALGGVVFRRALWEVREKLHDEEVAAMKADLAQFKSEVVKAHGERRAKLQKKVDQLEAKIDVRQQKAAERREAFQARQRAKRTVLKQNASEAHQALKKLANTPV